MFRRRRRPLPPDLVAPYEAFLRCADQVDLAQRVMLRCVPSSARSLAIPFSVGADTLCLALSDATNRMDGWRHPALAEQWDACAAAIDETLGRLDAAVVRAHTTRELEVALAAVQDLLDPLHAFVDAEEAFNALR